MKNAQRPDSPGPAILEFMSEDQGHELQNVRVKNSKAYAEEALERARMKLSRYLERSVEIMTELAETSENDRVRLAAAEAIADRAGLGKSSTQRVEVSDSEHEAVRKEAQDLVKRIEANKQALAPAPAPDLDTLVVLEGEPASSE